MMSYVLDSITEDLDWRESEIAAVRIILSSKDVTKKQRQVLLRAAWAMLYAHYEGFCKNALTIFFDAVSNSGLPCEHLPDATRLYALGEHLKIIKRLPNDDFLEEVLNFNELHLKSLPNFPEVDTQSNLWPHILIENLEIADLSSEKVKEHEQKLKTLVGRRNKIAHGENNMIYEVEYYNTYEAAVYDVIYDLAFQIDSRLSKPPYEKKGVA